MTEFLEKIAEVFEKDITEIGETDFFRDYEEWDSVSMLSLIVMLEDDYGITIPRATFETISTLEQMYRYIKANG